MERTQAKYIQKFILPLLVLLLIFCGVSLLWGQYEIRLDDMMKILAARFSGGKDKSLEIIDHVIFQVRLPRIILACLVGAGLSVSGAALQGTFQNPLVSPDLLGVCAGAGFGASLAILLMSGSSFFMPLLSLIFGFSSILIVFFLAKNKGKMETISLVLSGIIVSSIFSALTSLIKYVADTDEKLPAITFWLMGSFANTSYHHIRIAIIPIVIGVAGLLCYRYKINLLSLGDEDAHTMGINPNRTRWAIILFATVTTAACVTVSGIIGWVGLVIPHICRRATGGNHGTLLPVSCLAGAVFMVVVDTLARNLTAAEIPIGILTALIGAPFFAVLYRRTKGGI
ncbi:FecCD family ABC transporter permease [Lacrimispora sp.]|uniref:FecCD family ABC transporter permease n=1 Tax=Lacrimispora sp. TaxID=2719234 RepID=UPI002899A1F4|nr:iron ABC transporter permease [Lacrimispora sp.]